MHPPNWTQVLGHNVKHNVFLIVTLENGFLFMDACHGEGKSPF